MIEEIRLALAAKPFQAFFLVTTAGRRYRVAGHEHVGFSPSRVSMLIWHEDGGSSPIRISDIVALEYDRIPAASSILFYFPC